MNKRSQQGGAGTPLPAVPGGAHGVTRPTDRVLVKFAGQMLNFWEKAAFSGPARYVTSVVNFPAYATKFNSQEESADAVRLRRLDEKQITYHPVK